uniref:Uncharacterized protein n=1 Tax=Pristionchus pacificus TaxID=54126 RepID=A0A2A6BKF2_PRIPA|eukprot:PDM66367.1 hypothetical protein PRIPAC_47784 [Pristionchus pacificus]
MLRTSFNNQCEMITQHHYLFRINVRCSLSTTTFVELLSNRIVRVSSAQIRSTVFAINKLHRAPAINETHHHRITEPPHHQCHQMWSHHPTSELGIYAAHHPSITLHKEPQLVNYTAHRQFANLTIASPNRTTSHQMYSKSK